MSSGFGTTRQRDGKDVFIAPPVGRVPTPFVFPPQSEQAQHSQPTDFAGGVRLDVSATVMPPNAASLMRGLRFEENGIRKDFGFRYLGSAAPGRVLGLGDHKLVESGQVFHRLVRIIRDQNGKAGLYVWGGNTWTLVDTSSEDLADVYLSFVSTQNVLLVADGTQILSWDEAPAIVNNEEDFPSGNLLTELEAQTDVTVSPGGALFNEYVFNYSVEIDGLSTIDRILTLAFLHEGDEIDTRSYNAGVSGTEQWNEESVLLEIPDVEDGDELSIQVKDFEAEGTQRNASFGSGSSLDFEATKAEATEAIGKKYTYDYDYTLLPTEGGPTVRITVGFYKDSGSGFVKIFERTHSNPDNVIVNDSSTFVASIDGMDAGDKFGMQVESLEGAGGSITPDEVRWQEGGITFEVHGFNKAVDADPSAGVEYDTEGSPVSTFGLLDADAPAASYIFAFLNRVVALGDDGDPQAVSASVNGDVTDWTGTGSFAVSLLDSRMDALDPVRAGGALADNVAVILRSRSIWRMVPTGSSILPFSITPWIEGVGTESPHSLAQVRDGIMFLGQDMIVYYFTGAAAPIPVGKPIQRRLVENVFSESDLRKVDAAYDPVFTEYYLKLPDGTVWIFDLGHFLETQELRWRERELELERIATVSLPV